MVGVRSFQNLPTISKFCIIYENYQNFKDSKSYHNFKDAKTIKTEESRLSRILSTELYCNLFDFLQHRKASNRFEVEIQMPP